ncbi:2-phosphosulfolactate phosphatase [Pontibacter sp. G13]|uniref:2-phosphosulfolactate phosphatase n=1 Tax=Pontibacter sp. G13 TaxID=3074898 RepID=UPI00288B05E8|nr:2-phosphosulfolactate phosphatase [Pontibacter sp. G13]WNJ21126.1 2-phosphosulfolactate phosphatase [Pontibacter sp. G13]
MNTKKFVHVCLTPALIDQFDVSEAIVVVIDILRATTTMCVAFDNGADHMVPVEHIDECESYKSRGYLTAGERSGVQIEGFDFGNSPFSYTPEAVQGKKISITTTNGTRAIKAAQSRGAKEIVVGSFCNISLLTEWLIEQNEHVCLVCAGWRDNVTLEDTIFAGALAKKLRGHFRRFQDTALVAETLFQSANLRKRFFFRHSSHYHRLVHLNLQEEVKYAMRRDAHPVLPLMIGNELHDVSKHLPDFESRKKEILERQLAERSNLPK